MNKLKFLDAVLMGLLAVSVILNAVFIHERGALRAAPPSDDLAVVGRAVPSLVGRRPDGSAFELEYGPSEKPVVLYAFHPSCGWCERNLANAKKLLRALRTSHRVVSVLTTQVDVKDYLARVGEWCDVVVVTDPAVKRAYGIGGTPHTLVVTGMGVIQNSWTGAYGSGTVEEVRRTLGVDLTAVLGLR